MKFKDIEIDIQYAFTYNENTRVYANLRKSPQGMDVCVEKGKRGQAVLVTQP